MSDTTSYAGPDTTSGSKTDAAKEAASTTAAAAKDQAAGVGHSAAQAGSQVASTAKEQGAQVVSEATAQARDLLGEARNQATAQAGVQKDRAISSVHGIADELQALLNGEGGQSGLVTELASQASTRLRDIATWAESMEPGDLLHEAKDFARRKPGTFLIGAAIAGLLAGRVTRSTVAAVHESDDGDAVQTDAYALATPVAYPADTYAAGAYTSDTYADGTGYPTAGTLDPALETVDVRPETTGIGYGARS